MCCSWQREAFKDARATHARSCSLLQPLESGFCVKWISQCLAHGNSIASLPSVCDCLTFVDSHPKSCQQSQAGRQAGRQRMKGERDEARSSPQILCVPVLILTKENTASWRKRSDLVVGLLKLSTKISVFSLLFELWGFRHRGRVLYLCLELNRPPVVFSRRCG